MHQICIHQSEATYPLHKKRKERKNHLGLSGTTFGSLALAKLNYTRTGASNCSQHSCGRGRGCAPSLAKP